MSILPAYPIPIPAKDDPDDPHNALVAAHAPLTLCATPSRNQLRHLWRAMAAENGFVNYSDLFPRTASKAQAAARWAA